jgi:hypothetical protein
MIYEQKYIQETERLIKFYQNKNVHSIKDYILICHNYISELRNLDAIEIYTELEYERTFRQVLRLVKETFRPDYFNSSFYSFSDKLVHWLDYEFMIYILGVQKQFRNHIGWNQLIELQYKFSMFEIQFKINTGFSKDFTQFAIDKIKLTDLWKISIK